MWINDPGCSARHRHVAAVAFGAGLLVGAATTLLALSTRAHGWIGEDIWSYWPLETITEPRSPSEPPQDGK